MVEQRAEESLKYSVGYVAFIDILGWSEIVRKTATDSKLLSEAISLLDSISAIEAAVDQPHAVRGISVRQVSDAIFVTVDARTASQRPERAALFAMWIAREAFKRGFLCRGGITIGEYWQEKNKLLGPAVERAYRIEQAVHLPIIAVDPCMDIRSEFLDQDEYGGHSYNWDTDGKLVGPSAFSISPLAVLKDGTLFVDWLRQDVSSEPTMRPVEVFTQQERDESLNKILENEYPLSVRSKIEWFRRYSSSKWRLEDEGEIMQLNFQNNRDLARWVKSEAYFERFRYDSLREKLPPL